MKLNVSNTRLFKKKLGLLSEAEQARLNGLIHRLAGSYQNGKAYFNKTVSQPYAFQLKNNLESSLYSSKISPALRLIFSVDEDPLFGRLDITLFDLTDKSKEETRFRKIGENLYKAENLLS